MNDPLTIIRARRRAVQEDILSTQARLEELNAESRELVIAERVLLRLNPEPGGEHDDNGENERTSGGASVKPAGIPTMPEMIFDALRSANVGLSPKAIMEFIAGKYWPEVRSELVGPIAWRMAKEGRLVNTNGLYHLPITNEPAGTPSESAPTGSNPDIFS